MLFMEYGDFARRSHPAARNGRCRIGWGALPTSRTTAYLRAPWRGSGESPSVEITRGAE
jgi:hypothetical protein